MTRLEQELARVKQRAVEMGTLAQSMASAASGAIIRPDHATVEHVLASEPRLDTLQVEIDREAIRLVTVYSPAARDLRFLLMIARIITELERIGDHAVNTCEYVELLRSHPLAQPLPELTKMSALALGMLGDALAAFQEEDAQMARAVMQRDDEIDAINARIVRDLLEHRLTDREAVTRCVGVLVARSLERIADHATNICEEVFYVVSGEDIRHAT